MHYWRCRARKQLALLLVVPVFALANSTAGASDTLATALPNNDELWQSGLALVEKGKFGQAYETIRQIQNATPLTNQVREWLAEYQAKEKARKEIDKADFARYVGYAKARIERKEYDLALGWSLAALDCIQQRDELLREEWLQELVNVSLTAAEEARKNGEWRDAWGYYSQLGDMFQSEPRYRKLEREILTHLRFDSLFSKDNDWEERIDNVKWKDAKKALEYVGLYYVERPDFKKIAESGLKHLLLLAESPAARERLEGLKNEADRNDFIDRVKARLEQIRKAPSLDRRGATEHFRRVLTKTNKQTVQLPEELLVSELMRGGFEPLDDFTTIIWPEESEEFDKHTRGDFIGVGISIIKNRVTDEIEVVSPLEGAPAYYAGIQAGDVIALVNGDPLKDLSLNKVVHTITGPAGTTVTLTIRRGEEELVFPLVRERIKIRSVKGLSRDPADGERWNHWLDASIGLAYIRITNFQSNTQEDLENVLSELQADGLRGLVLDLRGNPGGLLDSAYSVSKLFLNRGDNVVSTKGRNRSENQTLDVMHGDGAYSDLPVTVLADESSASASEIVAGAIRDNHHGTVIGARTFGKFSVQNLIPLGHSNAKLKITTARYYLPSGVSLHRDPGATEWGVDPDIPVRLVRWERYNFRKMRRDADLLGPPKPTVEKKPETSHDKSAGEEEKSGTDDSGTPEEEGSAKTADAETKGEPELPRLEQPDENNRPLEDPQLDAAALFMRIKLLRELHPTLATAETKPQESRNP